MSSCSPGGCSWARTGVPFPPTFREQMLVGYNHGYSSKRASQSGLIFFPGLVGLGAAAVVSDRLPPDTFNA